ncbi:hypothetical protein [uncultured Arcticibacterium sp.]|uniref:hypothetical protein n=1 Tax=uncultured Arcticibacterium sp. TaxID=2173042 RepID=UPI0030F50653
MSIINSKTFFNLRSVTAVPHSLHIQLILDGNPYLPREFNSRDFKTYKLEVHLLSQNPKVLDLLERQIGEYIEISKEGGFLLFSDEWSFVGKLEFEKFEEVILEYGIDDWQKEYQSLIEIYYKEYDSNIKESRDNRVFIDKLKVFLDKEIKNTELKNTFLKHTDKSNSNQKKMDLAVKILNLIEIYQASR